MRVGPLESDDSDLVLEMAKAQPTSLPAGRFYNQFGSMKIENEWKNKVAVMPLSERGKMVDKADPQFPVAAQCAMLDISRSLFYHRPKGVSQADLDIMARRARMQDEYPTRWSRRWRRGLAMEGIRICQAKSHRLMRIKNIGAVGHRKITTKSDPKANKYPLVLGGLSMDQVWQIDISYIPMCKGYMYLTAIIDVCSRIILGWSVSNTIGADVVVA